MTTKAIEAGARDDLLPCPFCGSGFLMGQEPHDNHPFEGKFYIFHEHISIDCAANKCRLDVRGHFDTKEEAVTFWNTRAAIASGALVPASAVAEMRERCAQAGWKAAYDSGQIRRHTDTPDEVANAIRQLDLAPASGDYVVGWRTMDSAPKDMTEIIVLCGPKDVRLGWYFAPSSTTFGWLDQRQRPIKPTRWMPMPMLNAASSNGGEK